MSDAVYQDESFGQELVEEVVYRRMKEQRTECRHGCDEQQEDLKPVALSLSNV